MLILTVGDANVFIFIGNCDQGARVRLGGGKDEVRREILVKNDLDFLGNDGVELLWRGMCRRAVRRNGNLKSKERARAEVGFEGGEHVRKVAEDVAKIVVDLRRVTVAVNVKGLPRR